MFTDWLDHKKFQLPKYVVLKWDVRNDSHQQYVKKKCFKQNKSLMFTNESIYHPRFKKYIIFRSQTTATYQINGAIRLFKGKFLLFGIFSPCGVD